MAAQFLPRPKLPDGFAAEVAVQELESHDGHRGHLARLQCTRQKCSHPGVCECPAEVSIRLLSCSFIIATSDEFAGRSEDLLVGKNVPASARWKEVVRHQLDTA